MFFKKEDKLRQEISELRQEIDSLKQIVQSSIGNNGVQTDIRQTALRQSLDTTKISLNKGENQLTTTENIRQKDLTTTKEDVSAIEVVNLMHDFKESLIKKFKAITEQEFFVFNIIYSLEEQLGAVSYRNISEKAGISESAVRDHVRGLIKKGIPLNKEKSFLGVTVNQDSHKSLGGVLRNLFFFQDPSVYYNKTNDFLAFIYYLVWWIVLINFFVALFNMLPVGILDGGRFFLLAILSLTGNETIAKRAYKILAYIILFMFLALIVGWIIAL